MHKIKFAGLVAVGACCVACGGGGGSSTPNPFAGTFLGEYIDQNGAVGQFQITVSSSGAVSGPYQKADGTYSTFSGNVSSTGKGGINYLGAAATIQLSPSQAPTTAAGGQPTYTLSINPVGGSNPSALVVLIGTPTDVSGSTNPFSGSYGAKIQDTTLNEYGALVVNVDSLGLVTGSEVFNVNGTPTVTQILGTLDPTGQISYTVERNQVKVSGTLTLATTVAGTMQQSNGDAASLTMYRYGGYFGPPPPKKLGQ